MVLVGESVVLDWIVSSSVAMYHFAMVLKVGYVVVGSWYSLL